MLHRLTITGLDDAGCFHLQKEVGFTVACRKLPVCSEIKLKTKLILGVHKENLKALILTFLNVPNILEYRPGFLPSFLGGKS